MRYLTESEIRHLPTARILSYKKKHFPCRYKFRVQNDIAFDCDCSFCKTFRSQVIEYETTYDILKKVLSERENIERK